MAKGMEQAGDIAASKRYALMARIYDALIE
jgi:hypothetical protein